MLRILAILFSITGIALTAWALASSIATGNEEDGDYYYYGDEIAFIPWNLITVSLNLLVQGFTRACAA